ncbi:hypothetical protein K2Z83_18930 [Oscillochloris sp. ZM17-4]|uniref:hypothetical protein n=1 Tax=Oscillochloris sp. ZM17-4 TaxID=2866714 RepID=UPI001C73C528|nr:hypothetical protein [Oscillochloris sp. ZM17-4]MBX0329748.1 hypothetical protein [Oscillochloris sp. ZM17-4]
MNPAKVIIVMPAYNAAQTLERTYHNIPRDVADHVILVDDAEASSINFRRSVRYGLATMGVLGRYLAHISGARRSPQFSTQLSDILSPYHRKLILHNG